MPGGSTAIVKQFHQPCEEWAREAAALQVLPASVLAPRLLAATADPPTVVMIDLGSGVCVADALLGRDRGAARAALVGWAEAIARLHSATSDVEQPFAAALRDRDPAVLPARMPALLNTAADELDKIADEIGAKVPAGALRRLRALLPAAAGESALSPADACPDNNVTTPAGLALLDFEGAEYRHVAWAVAYLSVPWPSCWCSWQLPADVRAAALRRYRDTADLQYVNTPQFDDDLVRSRVGWALLSTSRFAANALGDDPPPSDPRIVAPPRRAMILNRLADAADARAIEPQLAKFAENLHHGFSRRWSAVPLEYAPAFQPTGD